jgi:hypothetical protein
LLKSRGVAVLEYIGFGKDVVADLEVGDVWGKCGYYAHDIVAEDCWWFDTEEASIADLLVVGIYLEIC